MATVSKALFSPKQAAGKGINDAATACTDTFADEPRIRSDSPAKSKAETHKYRRIVLRNVGLVMF